MALSKQDAQNYIKKYIDSDFDHVLTCSTNIAAIISVAASLGSINDAVSAATAAAASATAAAGSVSDLLEDVNAGTGITIDKTDTRNPILNVTPVTAATLGLNNVDNTTDVQKQTATLLAADASDVDLGNVDNTSDLAKPISTAVQAALDLKSSGSSVTVPVDAVFTDTTYTIKDGELSQINFTTTMNARFQAMEDNANNYVHPTDLPNRHMLENGTTNNNKLLAATGTPGVYQWVTPVVNTDTDTVYTHPSTDGFKHVPANATGNDGKVLTASATPGLYTWETPTGGGSSYTHPTTDGNIHVPANSTTNAGRVLTASATAGVYTWEVAAATSPLTTKGDLYGYTTLGVRIGVGSDDQVLTASAASPSGLIWKTPAAAPVSASVGDHVVSGGMIWSGTGLVYESVDLVYVVNDVTFTITNGTQVTLTAADGANSRIDAIFGDDTGALGFITGTPASTPIKPNVDTNYQLELTFALIIASATTPSAPSIRTVYLENAQEAGGEFDTTSSNANIAVGSTATPITGAVSIKTVGTIGNGDTVTLSHTVATNIADFQFLKLDVKCLADWNGEYLSVRLKSGATEVASFIIDGTVIDTADLVTVNTLSIFKSQFSAPVGLSFDTVEFWCRVKGANNIQYQLDNITISEDGGSTTTPVSTVALDVAVDATGFTGNLATTDTDLQKVSDKVDALVLGGGSSAPMKGIRIEKSASQASTTGEIAVLWQTEIFDDGGYADLGTNATRITIPAGVTRVVLNCGIDTASTSFTTASMIIAKNGESGIGQSFAQVTAAFSGSKGLQVNTGILSVVEGDYFEVKVNFSTSVNLDATSGTFFSMTVLDGATGPAGPAGATGGSNLLKTAQLRQDTNRTLGGAFETYTFETEVYDDGGWADIGTNNDRFTVPAGITRVNLSFFILYTGSMLSISRFQMGIYHYNSSDVLQNIVAGTNPQSGWTDHHAQATALGVNCVTGDYFIVRSICQDSATTTNHYTFTIQDATQAGQAGLNANRVDLATFIQNAMTDNEKLLTHVATTAFTLPVGLTDSRAYTEVVSTAAATIDIQVNGVSKGSINFATATAVGTFTFASEVVVNAGDRLSLVAQASADATLADIAITLRGTL